MIVLYSMTLSCLLISYLLYIGSFNPSEAATAKETLIFMSSDVFGRSLPEKTNSLTCSTFVPSRDMISSLGDRILHLDSFIFTLHFLQALSS